MLLELNFYSKELRRETQVSVILPRPAEGEATVQKVLWLFHGLTDNHTTWMRRSSIERYADANNLAVVMPNVDRSWYTDTACGANYFAFVTKELPELCYNTFKSFSKKREDHFIGGLSMGGYGALKAALTYPEQYCACISLSGALDIPHYGDQYRKNEMQSIFGFEMESCLELVGGKEDVFALAKENQKKGLPFPKIFMWCGLEDSLLPANRAFDGHLSALGVAHHYEESEGNHSWKWWDLHIERAIRYVLDSESK